MMNPGQTPARLANIDGLRAVAILLVLITHTWVFFGAPALSFSVAGQSIALASLPAIGHVGVNLFLVISGFSLAWPFMNGSGARERYSLAGFFQRRVQRIVPPYYASIVLIYLLALGFDFVLRSSFAAQVAQHPPTFAALESASHLWPHLLLIHNLWPDHVSTINGSYWSLALEFQLYLLFPLLIEAMRRWGVWRVAGGVLALQLAYRWSLEATLPAQLLTQHEFVLPAALPGRMFEFAAGIAAAAAVAEPANPIHRLMREYRGAMVAVLGWLGVAFFASSSHRLPSSVTDLMWALGFVALIIMTSVRATWLSRWLSWRPVAALGLASYSVYLLHQPLIERLGYLTLLRFRPGTAFFIGLALLPVVVAVCLLLFVAVEKPSLRWIQRGSRNARSRSVASDFLKPVIA
jgi:peptidoglycan/LPS O-acetylase OafA/YrhL